MYIIFYHYKQANVSKQKMQKCTFTIYMDFKIETLTILNNNNSKSMTNIGQVIEGEVGGTEYEILLVDIRSEYRSETVISSVNENTSVIWRSVVEIRKCFRRFCNEYYVFAPINIILK